MGEEILVEQIDAGATFVEEFNEDYPVSVACWVVPAGSDGPVLYVASDSFDGGSRGTAYREVANKLKNNPWIDPFSVKLIGTADAVARDAIEIRDRRPAPLVTRYGGSSIGGVEISGACIYPPVSTAKAAP